LEGRDYWENSKRKTRNDTLFLFGKGDQEGRENIDLSKKGMLGEIEIQKRKTCRGGFLKGKMRWL